MKYLVFIILLRFTAFYFFLKYCHYMRKIIQIVVFTLLQFTDVPFWGGNYGHVYTIQAFFITKVLILFKNFPYSASPYSQSKEKAINENSKATRAMCMMSTRFDRVTVNLSIYFFSTLVRLLRKLLGNIMEIWNNNNFTHQLPRQLTYIYFFKLMVILKIKNSIN